MSKNKPFTPMAGGPGPTKAKAALEPEPTKMVPKKITCSRCDGDGVWHTSATGIRLATISGPVIDTDKPCPKCKGNKVVRIMITEEQAKAEKAEKARRNKKAKDQIDAEARAAKRVIDEK